MGSGTDDDLMFDKISAQVHVEYHRHIVLLLIFDEWASYNSGYDKELVCMTWMD